MPKSAKRRSLPDRVPGLLLRAEGLAIAAGALALYYDAGYDWLLLVVLVLAPDVGLLAYLFVPRAGSALYNALHTSVLPVALGVAGVLAESELAIKLALIWLVHIGVDRLVGYGLKYPGDPKQTHLQRV